MRKNSPHTRRLISTVTRTGTRLNFKKDFACSVCVMHCPQLHCTYFELVVQHMSVDFVGCVQHGSPDKSPIDGDATSSVSMLVHF